MKTVYGECNICKRTTEHKYIGTQRGINGKVIDLYNCQRCLDTHSFLEEITGIGATTELPSYSQQIKKNEEFPDLHLETRNEAVEDTWENKTVDVDNQSADVIKNGN